MNRIWHPWHKWECFKAGLYETAPPQGMDADGCREAYRDFLADLSRFEEGLSKVTSEWTFSCEHFLTNESMNRIAYLGQTSMCAMTGVPAVFRGGFKLLSPAQQGAANRLADHWLTKWKENRFGKGQRVHSNVEGEGLF